MDLSPRCNGLARLRMPRPFVALVARAAVAVLGAPTQMAAATSASVALATHPVHEVTIASQPIAWTDATTGRSVLATSYRSRRRPTLWTSMAVPRSW